MEDIKQKEAFSSDDSKTQQVNKRELKINNAKSSIKPVQKTEDFRNKINKILANEDEQKKIAYQVMSNFQNILKDKTLDGAKNEQIRVNELQSIQDLIDFARIINSDENQEEDLGTITLLITLCRALFSQRDRINELEYKLFSLSKTSQS